MSKKQGARLLAGLSKLVEDQKRPNVDTSPPKDPKKIRICLDVTALKNAGKTETAAEYFEKVLRNSSQQDRFFEFGNTNQEMVANFRGQTTFSIIPGENIQINVEMQTIVVSCRNLIVERTYYCSLQHLLQRK